MKTRNIFGMVLLAAAFASCSQEDITTNTAAGSAALDEGDGVTFAVTDGAFAAEAGSRVTESGATTTFTTGDKIGVYAIYNGNIVINNEPYTKQASGKWTNSANKATVVAQPGTKFVAYYPYSSAATTTAVAAVAELTKDSEPDDFQKAAEDFMAAKIAAWEPATDQGDLAKYTAQDLMVAAACPADNATEINLTMIHQMAMLQMEFAQIHHGGLDMDKYDFDTYKPYNVSNGAYRLIVKPGQADLTITGHINDINADGTNNGNGQDEGGSGAEQGGWYTSSGQANIAKGYWRVFKHGGAAASLTNVHTTQALGDIIYSNGKFAAKYESSICTNGVTPVAVVFKLGTTSEDAALGYSKGYAMALKEANNGATLANGWGDQYLATADAAYMTESYGADNTTNAETGFNECIAELKGLTHCNYAIAHKGDHNLYAIETAKNFASEYDGTMTAPTYSSGWYLPSIGQLYYWALNCATDNEADLTKPCNHVYLNVTPYWDNNYSKKTATAINKFFSTTKGLAAGTYTTMNEGGGQYYWSSTERVAGYAFLLYFNPDGTLYFGSYATKSATGRRVRAVFAF